MQRYFQDVNQRKLLQSRRVFNVDKFGFQRRRQSHTLTRYFQSSPRNLASPRPKSYMQLLKAPNPSLDESRPTLACVTNTPRRFGPKTTNTLKMLKSAIKTPSNILKRLQGNVRVQLGKAKRLFQGAALNTGGESLAHLLLKEGVELGMDLEPLLRLPGQMKGETCNSDEGEWKEVEVANRPFRKVEEELEDLMSPDWRETKEAATDKARKELARNKFSNPVSSDPTNCLTFHGFRGSSKKTPPGSFSILEGSCVPLSGMKRKALSSAVHSRLLRVLRLADFGRVVQSKFAEAILMRSSPKMDGGLKQVKEVKDLISKASKLKVSNGELENFKVCLRHHRDALRETTNFLQYYNDRKGALVTEKVAQEVLDLEETFGFFREGYGEGAMDVIRCNLCGISHKSVHT